MIKVTGTMSLKTDFTVELDMTEEEFDALSGQRQDELIDGEIDWYMALRSADLDDIDVWDIVEIEE